MARKFIDCREFPGEVKCSIAIAADTDKELLEAAIQHAVKVHGYPDTAEVRDKLKTCFHDGAAPA
ncbi:MAG: DUF1059 domain-containing protein [Burkholderiales bacterium]|nr:MAG: DUF1059 domain-containing protein [Burkholderiales bacterium]